MIEFKGHISESGYEIIKKRFRNLRRFAKIGFIVSEFNLAEKSATIEVKQVERMTDEIYSSDDLYDFARDYMNIFINEGWKITIEASDYVMTGFDYISAGWLKERLYEYDISQRQLAKDLNIDEFTVSRLLKGKFGFTKWHKAALYYYFESINVLK